MRDAILYSGTRNASSWAMRAWLALREAGVDFREEIVDIRRPQRFPNLARIARFSPPGMVPVLDIAGDIIFDSLAIMEFANDQAAGRLLPPDPIVRAQARSILAWQHTGLSNICSRISFESAFYPYKRTLTSCEEAEAARLCNWLRQCIVKSGGPYLFGNLSLPDLALVPTILKLVRHGIDLGYAQEVQSWASTLLNRESVIEWLREADSLPHIWYDDYLIPDIEPVLARSHALGAEAPLEIA